MKKQKKVKVSRVIWSVEDDKAVLSSLTIEQLSNKLLRSKAAIKARRYYLIAKLKKDLKASKESLMQEIEKIVVEEVAKIADETKLKSDEEHLIEELKGFNEKYKAGLQPKFQDLTKGGICPNEWEVKQEESSFAFGYEIAPKLPKPSLWQKIKSFISSQWNK